MMISSNVILGLVYIVTYWTLALGIVYLFLTIFKIFRQEKIKLSYKILNIGYISAIIFYIPLSAFVQALVWKTSSFTKLLADLPLGDNIPLPGVLSLFAPIFHMKHGYLLHYSMVHFGLAVFWNLLAALILFLLLKYITSYKPYLMRKEELNLIIAGSLAIGWPHAVSFVVILFSVFLIHNIVNSIRGIGRTTILTSVILAIAFTFVFSHVYGVNVLSSLYFVSK